MVVVDKWNYEKRAYEPYMIPDEWYTPLFTDNMDEIVNCAACGRELKFGDCYTSKEIHTGIGLGYNVCGSCYEKEWERWIGHEKE